jgi:putative nucleotidyltransferase with HDIG domain
MARLPIVITDSVDRAEYIGRQVAGIFQTQSFSRHDLPRTKPAKYNIVDIDLEDSSHFPELRLWLDGRPKDAKALFALERDVRHQTVQAYALGATDVLDRPVGREALLAKLFGDMGSLIGDAEAFAVGNSDGISAGIQALQSIFASAVSGFAIDLKLVHAAGETIVSHIEAEGLDTVRRHHRQTYQHCLLVTGVAVTFGRHLGFPAADKKKLAFAGLLHDIGKAGVPVALLEKPEPLDGEEITIMRRHPMLGFEALRGMKGLDPDILDVVLRHHEYLDGSGYPDGLGGNELSDFVRMMTIADVFGALIERRPYRAALSCEAAYQVLENMGPKLDIDLVRELRPFARGADTTMVKSSGASLPWRGDHLEHD